eukprot:TRINITY_DN23195_c0_g1_i1.p1 TRINITY_DN23195_c0_g1~~TRINITY_DN23195_c0_g1_i1.p1  ORF type:complete len:143 (-),score=49.40 TRINITY_DN23195_c0_g1_i1:13-441(-)
MHTAEAMRAERERAEAAKRRADEQQRAEDDEVYSQVHYCHQRSADAFLDVLLPDVMEESASKRAMVDISTKSSKLDSIIGELENLLDDPTSVMEDLVSHFLLPEVEREELRWGRREKQNKYKKAAYDALVDNGDNSADWKLG